MDKEREVFDDWYGIKPKCGFVWNCSHSNGVFSDKFETFQVTHWMPLPDAPQESGND